MEYELYNLLNDRSLHCKMIGFNLHLNCFFLIYFIFIFTFLVHLIFYF